MALQLLNFAAAAVALAFGLVALSVPERIQAWVLDDPLRRRIITGVYGRPADSPSYVLSLRVKGLILVPLSIILLR